MPRKSNKTAHVLNLLTSTKDSAESEAAKDDAPSKHNKPSEKKSEAAKTDSRKKNTAPKKEPVPVKNDGATAPELDHITVHTQEAQSVSDSDADILIDVDTVNAVKDEISPEIIDEIHISKPVEDMAENVAEILLDNDTDSLADADSGSMYNVDASKEKMRALSAQAASPSVVQPNSVIANDAAESDVGSSAAAPFLYVGAQPKIVPSPMPKSAVASMLIAQRKEDEQKAEQESSAEPAQEISEQTPSYESEDMTLVNLTERAAAKRIPDIMKKFNMCSCERCYYDVLALTLNSVSQKTVIIPKDDIESKIKEYELDATVDLVTAISKSCVHVKISPRHQKNA